MARVCAYCGSRERLTREHLFPAFLQKLMPTYDVNLSSARPGKVTGPTTIRDVCQGCNNERLSALDEYGRGFCIGNVRRFVRPGETGSLKYDYHKLARWIWKVHYNTARADKGRPSLYRPLVPYILGDDDDAPQPQTLLAGVIRSYKTTTAERAKYHWAIIFPRAVRAADATLGPFQRHTELCRLLSLNSYIFWSILWNKGVSRPERRQAITSIARVVDMSMLAPSGGTVSLRESSYPGFEVRAYFSRGQTMREVFKHSIKGRVSTLR
jgi:hypothetical protein